MNIFQIGILVFAIFETLNILMLYSNPGSKMGNALGVFKAWDTVNKNPDTSDFAHYMAWWVAGAKLIFILLGFSIIIWGNIEIQAAACGAMAISIASFYYKLYPTIKRMDNRGQIEPKGYSKILFITITCFIIGFTAVFVIGLFRFII